MFGPRYRLLISVLLNRPNSTPSASTVVNDETPQIRWTEPRNLARPSTSEYPDCPNYKIIPQLNAVHSFMSLLSVFSTLLLSMYHVLRRQRAVSHWRLSQRHAPTSMFAMNEKTFNGPVALMSTALARRYPRRALSENSDTRDCVEKGDRSVPTALK